MTGIESARSTLAQGWHASLDLGFAARDGRTVLATRRHDGPLVVQKPLYPEGDAVCHAIVVHPPGGIAGGDTLDLRIGALAGARALLTTPGATKWYRSTGATAHQRVSIDVAAGASIEWLPQETIVFDRARAHTSVEVRLAADAVFIGWEILCLGRTLSGESFREGVLRMSTTVTRDDVPLWIERARLAGDDPLLASPIGMSGHPVAGTMLLAAPVIEDDLLAACRAVEATHGRTGITRLPGLLVARYLGERTEAARAYFAQVWQAARAALIGRPATPPRIWHT